MMAPLNDGHGFVTSIKPPPSLGVPLAVGKAENQVVVTQVLAADLAPQVRPGDIVVAIDGVPAANVLRERASLVSGSPQNKEARALAKLLNGPATPLDLTLRRGRTTWHLRVPRSQASPAPATPRADKWLAPGVYYYDMATYGKPFTAQNYDTLARAKAVIFDVRGYPGEGIMDVVNMLLKAPAEATFMYNLDMLRPDQEGLRLSPNVGHYTPDPRHLSGKMYFLTDANTQSYPETFLALIRGFKLGTLVGQPTSGANGNVSGYNLQGGLAISYSGLYVQNVDGSRHHAIGIKPDVLVTPTLDAIRNGQDLTLETALNLAKASK
jgi:C-terminal processing protease CtpA/Prc